MSHETELNKNISGTRLRLPTYEEVDEIVAKAFPGGGGYVRPCVMNVRLLQTDCRMLLPNLERESNKILKKNWS